MAQIDGANPMHKTGEADVESANTEKTTSTKQMAGIVGLSLVAAVFTFIQMTGYLDLASSCDVDEPTACGLSEFAPPAGVIVIMASLMLLPVAISTPIAMFVHLKPSVVLLGSKQMTDQLREKFANPFKMKYLFFIQGVLNFVVLIIMCEAEECEEVQVPVYDSNGYATGATTKEICYEIGWQWPCAFNLLNGLLYFACLALVFSHFMNPNVATSLSFEMGGFAAGSGGGGGASEGRVKTLETTVTSLQEQLDALSTKVAALEQK